MTSCDLGSLGPPFLCWCRAWLASYLFISRSCGDDMTCGKFLGNFLVLDSFVLLAGGEVGGRLSGKGCVDTVHTGLSVLPTLRCGSVLADFCRHEFTARRRLATA
jgi:hypothetical protein